MKTNLDKDYKADKKLEQEGVDFILKYADEEEGTPETSFRLRRFVATNPRVKAAMAAYYKPYARQIESGQLPPEKDQELSIRLFIDVCLVSWKGVLDDKNQEIPCTKENALALFQSLPEVFSVLQAHANSFQNYKADVGNS